jgi:hypothetical protein
MMDVFCCTLGCVILLWLANQREARLRAQTLAKATDDLAQSRSDLDLTGRERDDLRRQLAGVEAALRRAQQQSEATARDLAAARTRADELSQQLADLRTRAEDAEDRLAKKALAEQQLTRQQADALRRITELEGLLRDQQSQATAAESRATDLSERLARAESRLAELKRLADALPDARDAASAAQGRADEALAKLKALERDLAQRDRDLAAARGALDQAQGGRADLLGQISRLRAAAENRFEGIQLTGRRVIFLVDMSGSMELVDDRTPDTGKWPAVRDAVLKVMRSLPGLEQFQVLLFSDGVTFPLGQANTWLAYDSARSPEQVGSALAAIKPKGNTNMYAALEAVFRYRSSGLDTVYLFSDGLPNVGAGLDPNAARTMRDVERGEVLARYVRSALRSSWNAPRPGQPRVRVNTVGFFYESPDLGSFLWALARENDGGFVGMSRP